MKELHAVAIMRGAAIITIAAILIRIVFLLILCMVNAVTKIVNEDCKYSIAKKEFLYYTKNNIFNKSTLIGSLFCFLIMFLIFFLGENIIRMFR